MCYEIYRGIVGTMTTATSIATTTRDPLGTGARPHRTLDWRLRFGALSLIWGFSFLLIKVGTNGYAPFQVTLAGWCSVRRCWRPRWR